MKKEDVEFLSLEEFEDDFMLNNTKEPLIKKDDIVDTNEEKDFVDEVELDSPTKEETKETRTTKYSNTSKSEKEKKSKKDKKLKEKKPTNKKVLIMQIIFCTISIVFILGCCFYYGSRMLKYYKIYNPKTEDGEVAVLLGSSIVTDASISTTGDGLYKVGGAFIYKGEKVDNYIYFANTMWRIMNINTDGSIDMTTDSYVNALDFNSTYTDYSKSDIRAWLNDTYLKTLNKDMLANVTYCLDTVNDLSSITCNQSNSDDIVRLIGINEFLNSEADGKTYLNSADDFWLYNTSDKAVWHSNVTSLGLSSADGGYLVKPVVRIKNSTQLISGKGTEKEPYIIEKENKNLEVGNYVKLGNESWVIYEVNKDNVKLALSGFLGNTYRFSNVSNNYKLDENQSLANYLNTTVYESVDYKTLMLDTEFYNGNYTSYKDVLKSSVKAKLGLLNVNDPKVNLIDTKNSYYLLTPGDTNYTYMTGSTLRQSKVTISRYIKPTISIKKTNVESGKGTSDDPYILGK